MGLLTETVNRKNSDQLMSCQWAFLIVISGYVRLPVYLFKSSPTLVRGLNYSFPCGLVYERCSALWCLSSTNFTFIIFLCCDVLVLPPLYREPEDKSAGFTCPVWNSCEFQHIREMHTFKAQLPHTHQLLKQMKQRNYEFFFYFSCVTPIYPLTTRESK